MKQTSALSTLQNGSFRKGTLRFRFVASILLERISLKLLTNKYSFLGYTKTVDSVKRAR